MQRSAAGEIWVSTATSRLHARVEGRDGGPWLTLLHSLATDLHLWDREAAILGEHFRVLRLDMRGHGLSSTTVDNFTIEDLRDDVVAVWTELGVTRSSLLGLSIGGMIALSLGVSVPERIVGVVAADCRADAPPAFRAMWGERQLLLEREGIEAIAAATLPSWFTSATLRNRPDFVQKVEQMITATSVSGYLGATKALQGLTLLPTLGAMTCPVLYLVGEEDGVHPQAMQAMQQATPASQLVSLVGAAHLSNLEQPQGFMSAVLPFLLARSDDASP